MLYQDPRAGWSLTLTRRPASLSHHGGQICLPGGRIEQGESATDACLREYEEELGITPPIVAKVGSLDTQLVYASGNQVFPIVFVGLPPADAWRPDPVEVSEVIELPMARWLDPRFQTSQVIKRSVRTFSGETTDNLQFTAPGVLLESLTFQVDGSVSGGLCQTRRKHFIWGATAMMIEQLARILHPT